MMSRSTEKAWMIYRTICEMVKDRGYTRVISGHMLSSREEFVETMVFNGTIEKDDLTFTCSRPGKQVEQEQDSTEQDLIMIFFAKEESFGIKPMLALIEKMTEEKMRHCILIYPKTVTAPVKKHILKGKHRVEFFSEDELVLNITKHKLMPKHVLLTTKEKTELLTITGLKETQLPRILPSDPMAKYLGARRGDIVRIVRRSETAGKCVLYRACS